MTRVDLRELLSVCVCLASKAGQVIRDVQQDRETNGRIAFNAQLKDPNDSRSYLTVADRRAQKVILHFIGRNGRNYRS